MAPDVDATAGTPKGWYGLEAVLAERPVAALLATYLAACLDCRARVRVSASAWYHKQRPTFADTLAAIRREIWSEQGFALSRHSLDATKLPPALREGIAYALCHAA